MDNDQVENNGAECDNQNELEEDDRKSKKMKLFSAKDFINSLSSSDSANALHNFLQHCRNKDQNYVILEYLQLGGSCMEILQMLEKNTEGLHPNVVLEILYHIILRVSANYPQFYSATHEACQYLLNNFMTLINKTLGLTSTVKDRRIMLKLLTALVTFSANLAKDILVHVNFNPGILDVFIKDVDGKDSVRNVFIHFLMAFIVDGHYPTIHSLLEKKGLLSSILHGLLYDNADVVCLVLMTMKNHILENPSITKTMKMKLFSTFVIRDIISLYNWKGPSGIKKKKTPNVILQVDEIEKSKVNESIHSFLLVLCTSHKHGVIFKDHLVGMGKQQNSLMLTVLNGLERPWEHSYASELVIKICASSPDLIRVAWSSLKTYLEPRLTKQWLNAMQFAHKLLAEIKPSSVEFSELSTHQVAQVIQVLTAPTVILKVLTLESEATLALTLKYNVLKLIRSMLQSIGQYLEYVRRTMTLEKMNIVASLMRDHVERNFPKPELMFDRWETIDDDVPIEFESYDTLDVLILVLDICNLYETFCPRLLDNVLNYIEPKALLMNLGHYETEMEDKRTRVVIKTTNLFLNLDANVFLPGTILFAHIFPLIYSHYYHNKDESSLKTLIRLYKSTGIFEDGDGEIDIWINSIHSLKKLDQTVPDVILDVINHVASQIKDYAAELTEIERSTVDIAHADYDNLLEILSGDVEGGKIKKRLRLSPLILGYLHNTSDNKYVRCYFNSALINLFHLRSNPGVMIEIVKKYQSVISDNVSRYVIGWWSNDLSPLEGLKGRLTAIEKISNMILLNVEEELTDHELNVYPNFKRHLVLMCTFYMTNLVAVQKIDEHRAKNCSNIVKLLIRSDPSNNDKHLDVALNDLNLLRYFDVNHKKDQMHKRLCTKYVMELIKEFKCPDDLLSEVRDRLYASVAKLLKLSKRNNAINGDVIDALHVIQLNIIHCNHILHSLAIFVDNNKEQEIRLADIALYVLERYHSLSKNDRRLLPMDRKAISFLSGHLRRLNAAQTNTARFAKALYDYLNLFPHLLRYTDIDLFASILLKKEYCKENALLAALLLKSSASYLTVLSEHVRNVCNSKGLLLALLDAAIAGIADSALLTLIYEHFEPSVTRAMEKPQKAVAQFNVYRDAIDTLVRQFHPIEKCLSYVENVQKFETTETFHVQLLCTVFDKVLSVQMNEKHLNNCIVTLVHLGISLLKKKGKTAEDWAKIRSVTNIINDFLKQQIDRDLTGCSFEQVQVNETYLLYSKFCLKFGLSGHEYLLTLLITFCRLLKAAEDRASLLIDMILSHSDFLDVVLNDNRPAKTETFDLMLVLCRQCPKIMAKNHVPILLASYRATWSRCDKIILSLLRLYESAYGQTHFYDFKPFLWNRAAANYYSVRSDVNKALWRQPKTSDIVGILEEKWIDNTAKSYPLNNEPDSTLTKVYDFNFLLPIFSYMLAPENSVQTYRFCRGGALSLTLLALSCETEATRAAACYVLYRFYNQLEAKPGGNDKLINLRLIDAVCKGMAKQKDCKLNNFASIFFSRMASILTQPSHVMYLPLTRYLSAKEVPNIGGIPELYTFLHSSDVDYKQHRRFVLEVIRDGMRTDRDLMVALKAMAFKLIMELFNSSVCDVASKIIVLEILVNACRRTVKGVRYLCNVHGLISFLYHTVTYRFDVSLVDVYIDLLYAVITGKNDYLDAFAFGAIVAHLIDNHLDRIKGQTVKRFVETIYLLYAKYTAFLTLERLRKLLNLTESVDADYYLRYADADIDPFFLNDPHADDYHMKLLMVKYVQNSKKIHDDRHVK